jgi:glycosyltransferase involved in cell wall biosynthesis
MNTNHQPRISVIIITYNQEELIGRAIDSVIIQKEWVYEIIVCDDCSTDNNWEVIKEYKEKYPDIIKPFRNEYNLGIFGNFEYSWSKPTGDAVAILAGDDELCNGFFAEANKMVEKNQIDYRNEAFCLYMDYKVIYPSKWLNHITRNNMIDKGFDPISLKIRSLICNRSTIYSTKILKQFTPVSKDIGIFADGLIDIQLQMYSTKSYYAKFVGSKYYARIGISVKTPMKEAFDSIKIVSDEYIKILDLSPKDKLWLRYRNEKNSFILHPSFKQYFILLKYFIKSIDWKYGVKGLHIYKIGIDHYYFLRRLL